MVVNTKSSDSSALIIHTLGHFNVERDGKSLFESSSGAKKVWELFKFMLSHRDNEYTSETLMDDLWFSEEYNDPKSTLRRQMYRLRQILGEEKIDRGSRTICFDKGYYRWNNKVELELDALRFENLVSDGNKLKDELPDQALKIYQKALELYKGDYLPACTEHWVFPIRNHFRHLFIVTVINTIDLLKERELYDDIIALSEKVIDIDIYEEVFHINLIEALLSKHNQRRALDHYQFITNFLLSEMDIKPSCDMKILYKKILKTNAIISSEKNFHEILDSEEELENGFYCEPEVFQSIYELEKRRCERVDKGFGIGIITFSPIKNYTNTQQEVRIKNNIRQLMKDLRKGDVITRWNDTQVLVLLTKVDEDLIESVLTRVLSDEVSRTAISINKVNQLAEVAKSM